MLRALPQGAGIILASNHADETDFKACLELSAPLRPPVPLHDEPRGVRRGLRESRAGGSSASAPSPWSEAAHNEQAKRYAIDAVKQGRELLVIFPEGEIYYLNDLVQPFKSGGR